MPTFNVPQGKQRAQTLKRLTRQHGADHAKRLDAEWTRLAALNCDCCSKPIGHDDYVIVKTEVLERAGVSQTEQVADGGTVLVHALCFAELTDGDGE